MKRLFSILFSVLAAVTLLVSVTVPHHHHGYTVCIVADHHEHDCDGHDNDGKYPSHHHNSNDEKTSSNNCIAKTSYIVSDQDEIISTIRPHEGYNNILHFVPIFLCLANAYSTGVKFIYLTKRRYKDKIGFHELENVNYINGLRAPPYSIA